MPVSTLSPSKHTGLIRIRFIHLYCLVIVVDNDQSIFGLASPFLHKFVTLNGFLSNIYITIILKQWHQYPNPQHSTVHGFSIFLWGKRKTPNKYWKSARNLFVLLIPICLHCRWGAKWYQLNVNSSRALHVSQGKQWVGTSYLISWFSLGMTELSRWRYQLWLDKKPTLHVMSIEDSAPLRDARACDLASSHRTR